MSQGGTTYLPLKGGLHGQGFIRLSSPSSLLILVILAPQFAGGGQRLRVLGRISQFAERGIPYLALFACSS